MPMTLRDTISSPSQLYISMGISNGHLKPKMTQQNPQGPSLLLISVNSNVIHLAKNTGLILDSCFYLYPTCNLEGSTFKMYPESDHFFVIFNHHYSNPSHTLISCLDHWKDQILLLPLESILHSGSRGKMLKHKEDHMDYGIQSLSE